MQTNDKSEGKHEHTERQKHTHRQTDGRTHIYNLTVRSNQNIYM